MDVPFDAYTPMDRVLIPDYYPDFHCAAERCRDTCCGGWNIDFGKKDYLTIRNLCHASALSETFQTAVKRVRGTHADETDHYAQFQLLENENCPFLSETGLCDLQLTCGAKALPFVCQTFPRLTKNTPGGFRTKGCSTGCEEVLRLLYQQKDGLGFLEEPLPPRENSLVPRDAWGPLGPHFAPLQELSIDLLQDRSMPLTQRLLMLGYIMRDLSSPEYAQGLPNEAAWLAEKRALANSPEFRGQLARLTGNRLMFLLNNIRLLRNMSTQISNLVLRLEVEAFLGIKMTANLDENNTDVEINCGRYDAAEQAFLSTYGDLDYFYENILVNTFFYHCYPFRELKKSPWENYFLFCSFYSFTRFLSICCGRSGEGELIHILTMASRNFLHSATMQGQITTEFQKYDNRSLQDLAVLVCG